MLRRIPKSELPAASAPRVVDLLGPEAKALETQLRAFHQAAGARDEERSRLSRLLRAALETLSRDGPTLSADQLRMLVDAELTRLRRARSIELRVHPHDVPQLEAAALLRARLALDGALRVLPDEDLQPGDCLLVSELGSVDARLHTRLERLCAALVEGHW